MGPVTAAVLFVVVLNRREVGRSLCAMDKITDLVSEEIIGGLCRRCAARGRVRGRISYYCHPPVVAHFTVWLAYCAGGICQLGYGA